MLIIVVPINKKRETCNPCPSHILRLLRLPTLSKRAIQDLTPIYYIRPYIQNTYSHYPLADIIPDTHECAFVGVYNIPMSIYHCNISNSVKCSQDFKMSKTKRKINAFHIWFPIAHIRHYEWTFPHQKDGFGMRVLQRYE